MGTTVPIFVSDTKRLNMTAPVSVIIPTFNRSGPLQRALESVLGQTLAAQDVCVVDDGSTDDTRYVVERYFPQVHYVFQENAGVSAARNLGVRQTFAPWLAFLDSDDVWHPDKLAKQMEVADRDAHVQLVHCDEIWIRNGRRVNPMDKHRKQGGNIFEQSLSMCAISPSAVLLKRTLFESIGEFDEGLPACEDYDLWLRICCRHAVHYIDEQLLTKYGGHEDQLSRKYWGMDRFRVRALQNLLNTGVLTESQRELSIAVLKNKCSVLLNGAKKRGNEELIAECELIKQTYFSANEF